MCLQLLGAQQRQWWIQDFPGRVEPLVVGVNLLFDQFFHHSKLKKFDHFFRNLKIKKIKGGGGFLLSHTLSSSTTEDIDTSFFNCSLMMIFNNLYLLSKQKGQFSQMNNMNITQRSILLHKLCSFG